MTQVAESRPSLVRVISRWQIVALSVNGAAIAEALHAHWTDEEIVEILGVVSLFGFLNRWNDSMGTTLESGASTLAGEHLADSGWEAGKHR